MQDIDAIATLASCRYSPDTARGILRDAMTTGSAVRRGVRVTYDARHGYRVARAARCRQVTRAPLTLVTDASPVGSLYRASSVSGLT